MTVKRAGLSRRDAEHALRALDAPAGGESGKAPYSHRRRQGDFERFPTAPNRHGHGSGHHQGTERRKRCQSGLLAAPRQ